MTKVTQRQAAAEGRAAIIAALTTAGGTLKSNAILSAPQVVAIKGRSRQAWWQLIGGMVESGALKRGDTKPYDYSIPTEHLPVVTKVRTVKEPKVKAVSSTPTISVDIDRSNGRLKIKVSGDLTLDLGLK